MVAKYSTLILISDYKITNYNIQFCGFCKNWRNEYHICSKKRNLGILSVFDYVMDTFLQAVKNLEDIEGRVQGMVRVKGSQCSSLALSVEGQANNLILEATDIDNLCEMYIGWGPFT
jgi:phosphatidylinositol kinase/protein kinase (PI-3  family)